MVELDNRDQNQLRGGTPPWSLTLTSPPRSFVKESFCCDILVVGAGITGALCGEYFAMRGYRTRIIDHQRPGHGSTTASTAMLLWEIDQRLGHLADLYGFERASKIYQTSFRATAGLVDLVESRGLPCGLRRRHSVYLSTPDVEARQLNVEHRIRRRAGLPGEFLGRRSLSEWFGINRDAAIVSPNSAESNPILLVKGILAEAIGQQAQILDAEAIGYHDASRSVTVELDDGHVIEAKYVVLATGYVMPDMIQSDIHKIVSTWAVATPPQLPTSLWRGRALIWEASEQYSYVRTTRENRIIIGGEDEESIVDPNARDQLIPSKANILLDKLKALWPDITAFAEFKWSGAFGTTADGLPLIGRVPGHPRIFAAYGYGGNGITYSYLASRVIGALIEGKNKEWFDYFAIDRSL